MKWSCLVLAFASLADSTVAFAQGPFQFREAYFLERRVLRSGEDYKVGHAWVVGRTGPSLALPFIPDASSLQVYTTLRWLSLLAETDQFRRTGNLQMAEGQYHDMLNKLRQAQGPTADDVIWLLDHIGDFYLEVRDFDHAYQNFSEALSTGRKALASQTNPQATMYGRVHMMSLLTKLGRLDSAKGDLTRATAELTEGVSLANESNYRRFEDGLDAIYFLSLVLEKQAKWKEAEDLWQQAVTLRAGMPVSDPYWDTLREMAAFYARHGDFHAAAEIAKRLQAVAGKRLQPVLANAASFESRMDINTQIALPLYKQESDLAMSEILAMDQWITNGPDAAIPLLQAPGHDVVTDRGADSERARLIAWFERKVFLRMSILLDGNPPQAHVEQAYEALGSVQGRYLAAGADATARYEPNRGTPNANDTLLMLDQRAAARQRRAHLFIATALDGKPFDALQYAASESQERAVSQGLVAKLRAYHVLSAMHVADGLPADAALINYALWDRIDRTHPTMSHREYGAFVGRKGQPLKYVRIGAADEIDADIAALETAVVGNNVRGVRVLGQQPATGPNVTDQKLRSLYKRLIAPLETSLDGVKQLYIVPDGKLAMAPIGAFIDSASHYLLERYTMTYLGSWLDLQREGYEPVAITPPVIVANPDFNLTLEGTPAAPPPAAHPQFVPLPGAAQEAADVAKILHVSDDRVLTGKKAREELVESIGRPEILHFATHSVPFLRAQLPTASYDLFEYPRSLVSDNPLLQSVIALAGANRAQDSVEDGLMTGLEAASLRLYGTRLVVLSSCESAQGTPVDGQGVLGLRAAFAMAGADGLVMSLWPVDDQAGRRFMQFFYSHLEAGGAEAVRMAQADMVTQTQYKEPQYWAGYVYSGGVRGRSRPAPNPPAPDTSQTFVSPNCYEISAHEPGTQGYSPLDNIRLNIGGVIRRTESSPQRAVYELIQPGSWLEQQQGQYGIKLSPTSQWPIRAAADLNWAILLTVERQPDHSGITVQMGIPSRMTITLKGGPALFPTLDFPEILPPLASYTQASVDRDTEKVNKIGFCRQ